MSTPSNGITPEVIRAFMPPYHLSPDLLAATIAALPRPQADTTTAWRQARLTRLFQEISDLHPADAAQARIAAQLLTTRELADAFTARAHTPDLDINQMCRLGRTADALLRSAAALERTLTRHQKMPTSFYGTVVQDQVDIPALEAIWSGGTPASTDADTPAPARTTTPSPATPQPAATPDPQPDPQPPPQAANDQSPDPTTHPGQPPAPPHPRAAGPNWVIEPLDQGPGWSREVLRPRSAADPKPEPVA